MAYLKKNIEALIDLKITDRGRELISKGEFCNIEYFQIGDSEYDYKNSDILKRDEKTEHQVVLRAKDKDIDIKYPIPVGETIESDLGCITYGALGEGLHTDETVTKKVEDLGITTYKNIKSPLGICVPLMNFDGSDTLVTTETISCEYIMVKFPQEPSNVLDNDGIVLWYKVISFIDSNTIQVDRMLPDFSHITDITKEATVFQYNKRETTEYVDFNIAWSEEFAGFDTNLTRKMSEGARFLGTKEYLGYTSYTHPSGRDLCNETTGTTTTTTTICPPVDQPDLIQRGSSTVQKFKNHDTGETWEYCSSYKNSYDTLIKVYPDEQKFIGIIHYTKWEDYYGTGEWWKNPDPEFELNLPTLMYHRDNSLTIGHRFKMDSTEKYVVSLVNDEMDDVGEVYYDLYDNTPSKNVVGKVFPNKQIVVIDDEEILMALSMKSNRNYTLPTPNVTRISSNADCIDSPDDVMLPSDLSKEVYVTYMFYDENSGIYSAPCAQYVKVQPSATDEHDVAVSFKNGFGFLRDSDITNINPGFQATKFFILVQQVDTYSKPTPDGWRVIEYTEKLSNHVLGQNIVESNLNNKKFIITAEDYNNASQFSYRDTIGYPNQNEPENMIFGDEFMLMGDLTLNKQHSIYVMYYNVYLPDTQFLRSQNPTWDDDASISKQPLRITEVALYNTNQEMVAIGKLSLPQVRNVDNPQEQTLTFKLNF